jgi:hypothetical protein
MPLKKGSSRKTISANDAGAAQKPWSHPGLLR